jgi:protein-L-isoaspartate(D-aspartate) O-methyltransferase
MNGLLSALFWLLLGVSQGEEGEMKVLREEMVRTQLAGRDISSPAVLQAMERVPRHRFVPTRMRLRAYEDNPLSIGQKQTISQPYIVALMSQLSGVQRGAKVLEIGTGSGYQAAVLAEMGAEVYSIEIVALLAESARLALDETDYSSVKSRVGDGYQGWPSEAPFDAILVTAAPPSIPQPLLEQLKVGGRLVIPVGDLRQELVVVERRPDGFVRRSVAGVLFVPMTGEAQR